MKKYFRWMFPVLSTLALAGAMVLLMDIAEDYRKQKQEEVVLDEMIQRWTGQESTAQKEIVTEVWMTEAISSEGTISLDVTVSVLEERPTEMQETEGANVPPEGEETEVKQESSAVSEEVTEPALLVETFPPSSFEAESELETEREALQETEQETEPVTEEIASETTTEYDWFSDVLQETEAETVSFWQSKDLSDYAISGEDIVDDTYYTDREGQMYRTEDAKGYLDSVLVVPKIGLKKGVYTGTWEDILYNLDIWMATVAQPSCSLGKTHYVIYGHNHTQQSLSFNRIPELQAGDVFYLVGCEGVYVYEVSRVFALSRTKTTNDIVKGAWGVEVCHIITCGRGENRYKQLIVEGMVQEFITLAEYQQRMRGR